MPVALPGMPSTTSQLPTPAVRWAQSVYLAHVVAKPSVVVQVLIERLFDTMQVTVGNLCDIAVLESHNRPVFHDSCCVRKGWCHGLHADHWPESLCWRTRT